MLQSVKQLRGFHIRATDGEIGEIRDVYFDDEHWAIRYFVVDTGKWLPGRKVLISPYAVHSIDPRNQAIAANLTRKRVEGSPGVDTEKPVSRQQEAEFHGYYGYPEYWPYKTLWAWGSMPVLTPVDPRISEDALARRAEGEESGSTHLRSGREVVGYHIQALDEPVGHVDDLLFEDDSWAVRYFVVDTRNWLPGKHVLVSTQWIREVSWPERTVAVDLNRREIEDSPEYDTSRPLSRSYETELHRHYERRGYWGS
jgi:uncharacterized protein YrrD